MGLFSISEVDSLRCDFRVKKGTEVVVVVVVFFCGGEELGMLI